MEPLRYHIIIDVNDVGDKELNDGPALSTFLNTLPGMIGMKVLNPPVVIEGVPENPGITGFVIIDFSHISIHTFTIYKKAMVDIFSCKKYSQEEALQAVLKHFNADRSKAKIKEVSWGL
ncbi:hypothetical protein HGB07_04730 [Candidatus Roizmanbacteria bacterium]|nr:hypothetical protein [Candidatus Roizmanbacteria bacterium]